MQNIDANIVDLVINGCYNISTKRLRDWKQVEAPKALRKDTEMLVNVFDWMKAWDLQFVVDGNDETYDLIAGYTQSFDDKLEGLKAVIDHKCDFADVDGELYTIGHNFIFWDIMISKLKEIEELKQESLEAGIDQYDIENALSCITNHEEADEAIKLMKAELIKIQ